MCVCVRVAALTCPAEVAFNATFGTRLLGESSGTCNVGFSGFITRQCLFNSTGNFAYWTAPTGSCTRTRAYQLFGYCAKGARV